MVNPFFFFLSQTSECFLFQVTGIANLLPGAVIDAALFDPCGYSANGLLSVSERFSYSLVNNIITRDICCSFGISTYICCGSVLSLVQNFTSFGLKLIIIHNHVH